MIFLHYIAHVAIAVVKPLIMSTYGDCPVIPSPSSYAFSHCADLQHVKKSVKLNNSPVTQTPGGPCIWLWKPLVEWTVRFHSSRDGCVSSSRPLRKSVKRSEPFQPPWQAEQPCGKRAVFATDFRCFTTGLHSNLCAWPCCDLQFHPETLENLV